MKMLKKISLLLWTFIFGLMTFTSFLNVTAGEFPSVINEPVVSKGTYTEDGDYLIYLSDINPTGYTSKKLLNDTSLNNEKISLLEDNEEVVFEKGLFTQAYTSIFYTDIPEQGYEIFEAYVGVDKAARNEEVQIQFKVLLDGNLVFDSGFMTADDELKKVSVDISQYQVIQLVVNANGNENKAYGVWAEAKFIKNDATPYLKVADLEFNLPEQVTKSNIMEYVKAYSVDGENLIDNTTYETDYVAGKTGEFFVTYMVKDNNNVSRSRTVKMSVTGENYATRLSIERLKKPWATYLYHGRNTLSVEGQKAWDVVLKEVLDFDASKWSYVKFWATDCYLIDIDLQALGIYTTANEMSNLVYMFQDDEPRSFILPDWETFYTMENGLVSHIKIYVRKNLADSQDYWLNLIEDNTVKLLEASKDDMTEAQRVYYVLKDYANWIDYTDGQQLHEALGLGHSVCGGNARGTVFLTQRLGVKSIFGRSGSHAWTYTKLYDYDAWFKNDLLAGPAILVDANSSKHNLLVNGNYLVRQYEWFSFNDHDYSRDMLRYPSVWINLENDSLLILSKNVGYNLLDCIEEIGSIFEANLTKDNVKVEIEKLDSNGNVVTGPWEGLNVMADGTDLKAGNYIVHYYLTSANRTAEAIKYVRVTSGEAEYISFNDADKYTGNISSVSLVGLWNNQGEKWYDNAIQTYEEASITFDISNNDYKYLTFDFGIKNSVRENVAYGSNGKVAIEVIVDDVVVYSSNTLGWKDHYISVNVDLPENSKNVMLKVLPKGAGNNHAAIGDLTLYVDDGSIEGIIEIPEEPSEDNNEIEDDIHDEDLIVPSIPEEPNGTLDNDKNEQENFDNDINDIINKDETNHDNSNLNNNNSDDVDMSENIDDSKNNNDNFDNEKVDEVEVKEDLQVKGNHDKIFKIIILVGAISLLGFIILGLRKKNE